MFENAAAAKGKPIEYFNRHTGRVEVEAVYGEEALRWVYETSLGRLAGSIVAQRMWFSHWYGWWMRQPASREKIALFIQKYGLDSTEFAQSPETFESFDAFFSRKLRSGVRPIESDPSAVVFGADGRHLGFQDVSQSDSVFVKGQRWNLAELLGDESLARRYAHGTLILSRLCPIDYHRFHFPADGIPGAPRLLNGDLWSVNPIALRRNLARLWQNKRTITILETQRLGAVILMEVGATNVGSITQTFIPASPVKRGDEKGFFSFGGSATLTLFEPGRIRLADDLTQNTLMGRELYAKVGSRLGATIT